jgi:hypothetical protein
LGPYETLSKGHLKVSNVFTTYLRCNILPFLLRDRIPQGDRRGIDEITLPFGHPQMDSTIRPCLHVYVPIPRLDFGISLEREGVRKIVGQRANG